VGKSLRVNWCLNTLLRELTGYDITTTRIRLLVECSIQDGLEDGIVSLPDRLAATRQIGHSINTFKLSYNPRHRRRDAQKASQAFTKVMTNWRLIQNTHAQHTPAPPRQIDDEVWRRRESSVSDDAAHLIAERQHTTHDDREWRREREWRGSGSSVSDDAAHLIAERQHTTHDDIEGDDSDEAAQLTIRAQVNRAQMERRKTGNS
jgi:hypothetical protein